MDLYEKLLIERDLARDLGWWKDNVGVTPLAPSRFADVQLMIKASEIVAGKRPLPEASLARQLMKAM